MFGELSTTPDFSNVQISPRLDNIETFAMIILPLITFICLVLILIRNNCSIRHDFVKASILWGCIVTWITEILSVFEKLSYVWLIVSYSLIIIPLLFIVIRYKKKEVVNFIIPSIAKAKLSSFLIILVSTICVILLAVLMVAVCAPPNNWDSMTYHMVRVVHWIQNSSVAHYPTHRIEQLCHGPWSEFAIAHFQILSRSDRFANIVQWFAMSGCIICVSLIAKRLGAGACGQVFSAIIVTTIPMGILQGSSTQNDYVLSFWIVCSLYYIILIIQEGFQTEEILFLSGSLGLAALTKTTAFVYLCPFVIWFLIWSGLSIKTKIWFPVTVMICIFLLINGGHFLRNIELFGSPIYGGGKKHVNETFIPPAFASNILRNAGLELNTPFGGLSRKIERAIYGLHKYLDIETNDPRTTFLKTEFHVYSRRFLLHEDTASSILHFLFSIMAISMVFIKKKLRANRELFYYCICVVVASLLFCLLLKWQPWHSRLHLPIFVLVAPVIGMVLSSITPSFIGNEAAILFVISSIPWLLFNASRPMIGVGKVNSIFTTTRTAQYFANGPTYIKPFQDIVLLIKSGSCKELGIYMIPPINDHWEYPLWILMNEKDNGSVQINHVRVSNESAKLYEGKFSNFRPCSVIAFEGKNQEKISERLVLSGIPYRMVWQEKPIYLFRSQY